MTLHRARHTSPPRHQPKQKRVQDDLVLLPLSDVGKGMSVANAFEFDVQGQLAALAPSPAPLGRPLPQGEAKGLEPS